MQRKTERLQKFRSTHLGKSPNKLRKLTMRDIGVAREEARGPTPLPIKMLQ